MSRMSRMTRSACVLMLCSVALAAGAADKSRIANEGAIGDQWMLAPGTKLAAPGYTKEMKESGDNVCVALGYAIAPDGKTSDFTVLRTYSSRENPPSNYFDQYTASAAHAVSQWAFAPRPGVDAPQRTVTVATLTFRGNAEAMDAGLASRCKISDLALELQNARHRNVDQGQLRRDMEYNSRAAQSSNSMISNPGQAQGTAIRGR